MRPRERRESGEQDLFRSRLDQVINMGHALAKLARTIDWGFLDEKFGAVYADGSGRPPLPTRLMAGLAILKHTYNLSDEVVCEQWIDPRHCPQGRRRPDGLQASFAFLLSFGRRVRAQERGQRGAKVYSLQGPRTGMHRQGKGSQALRVRGQGQRRHPLKHSKGGQFVAHARRCRAIPMMAILWPR